jgi:hypothetical protein
MEAASWCENKGVKGDWRPAPTGEDIIIPVFAKALEGGRTKGPEEEKAFDWGAMRSPTTMVVATTWEEEEPIILLMISLLPSVWEQAWN